MESTNLSGVKMTAQMLLRVQIHKTPYSPVIVQHPFTASGFVVLPGSHDIIDITANDENLNRWQDGVGKEIAGAKNVYAIYCLINPPYALTFLKHVKEYLATEDMSKILAAAWMQSECPNMDVDVSKDELVAMFKQADKEHLMEDGERKLLAQLGETITVYRGVTSYNAKNVRALSWTIDIKKARWFAHRFQEQGTVYAAQINKADILAVFTSRGESEIVLNPKGLKQLKKVEG